MIARAALCLLVLLVAPLSITITNAQVNDAPPPQTHIFISFENYDTEAHKHIYETIDGSVQFTPQYGALMINGTGTGFLRWDMSGGYCTDIGDLTFPSYITGNAYWSVGKDNKRELGLALQAFVGESLNDTKKYVKEYSAECFDEPNNKHFTEERSMGPVPLLPQLQLRANASNWDGSEGTELETIGSIMKVKLSPPQYSEVIEVRPDKQILTLTEANPKTVVTVTAMTLGFAKLKQMPVEIKICTEIGSKTTDGHIHDSRADKCDKANRPQASITYQGVTYKGSFTAITNDAGQIVFGYEPPYSYRVFKNEKTGAITGTSTLKLYIAGKDDIIATKVGDAQVKGESSITTKVERLQTMPFSENCAGNANYYFAQQGKHGCIFYSTSATNDAIARISKAFVDKQNECKVAGGKCSLINANRQNVTFTIVGNATKVRITAMSLPWGGLHDIGGDWKNPHITHSKGTAVDIGLVDYRLPVTVAGKTTMKLDEDRIKLLWTIISLDPNFKNFEGGEGNPYSPTVSHFHANFKS